MLVFFYRFNVAKRGGGGSPGGSSVRLKRSFRGSHLLAYLAQEYLVSDYNKITWFCPRALALASAALERSSKICRFPSVPTCETPALAVTLKI